MFTLTEVLAYKHEQRRAAATEGNASLVWFITRQCLYLRREIERERLS
jgi:hypothetical protein